MKKEPVEAKLSSDNLDLERAKRGQKRRLEAEGLERGTKLCLQAHSVSPATLKLYREFWEELTEFARENGCEFDAAEGDRLLAAWMEEKFMQGWNAYVGSTGLATVKYMLPDFGRGGKLGLPESLQAMRGWKKKAPAHSRLPLPWEVVARLAEQLVLDGYWTTGIYIVLTFAGYLRPSEGLKLRREDVIPPAGGQHIFWGLVLHPRELGMASKTQEYDEVVLLDLPTYHLVLPALAALRSLTPVGHRLFEFSQADAAQRFRAVSLRSGLAALTPVLYQLRHGGPSADIAAGRRTVEQVKLRGRWRCDQSVRRYVKDGRVGEQLRRLDCKVRADVLDAPRRLALLLRRPCGDFWPLGARPGSGRRSL